MSIFIGLIFSFVTILQSNISIDEYINTRLADYTKVEYEVISLPTGVKSINDGNLKFNIDKEFKLNGSYLYIPISYLKDGKHSVESSITLKVKLYKSVYVAKKNSKRGEIINRENFEKEEREISGLRGNVDIDFSTDNKFRARTNITANSILSNELIELNPVIKISDEIKAYSTIGSLEITFKAKAREEGAVGERIRIIREDNKVFKAEIIDSVTVKIIE